MFYVVIMRLASIQAGKTQSYGNPDKTKFSEKAWVSGIFKSKMIQPAMITKAGIVGDEQADLSVHGGPDKAICVYSVDHFDYWKSELGIEFEVGAFGENFSVGEVLEKDVCIGDIFSSGDVILQVTQPRQPCWKLARRWNVKELPALVQKNGKTGWYLRVLQEGSLVAPTDIELVERPYPYWTITHANHIMHVDKKNKEEADALASIKFLSDSWKNTLKKRVDKKR